MLSGAKRRMSQSPGGRGGHTVIFSSGLGEPLTRSDSKRRAGRESEESVERDRLVLVIIRSGETGSFLAALKAPQAEITAVDCIRGQTCVCC